MKIFKKILIALCILAVLSAAVCVFALAADTKYTVAGGMELVDAYNSASAEQKGAAAAAARKYYGYVSALDEGYEAYKQAYDAMEEDYVNNVLLPTVNAYAGAEESVAAKEAAMKSAYATLGLASKETASYGNLSTAVMNVVADFLGDWLYPTTQELHEGEKYQHILQNNADRKFLSYVTLYAFDPTNETYLSKGVDTKAAAVKAAYDARVAADREALYANASLSDYINYPSAQFMSDFESEKAGVKNPQSLTARSKNKTLPNDTANNANLSETVVTDDNTYYHLLYARNHFYNVDGKDSAVFGQHNYWDLTWGTQDSVVVEIDFSTEDRFPGGLTLQSAMDHEGGRIFPTWLSLDSGNFSTVADTKLAGKTITPISIPNVISPKQWTHFTFRINATGVLTVYIDYNEVGSWDSTNAPFVGTDYLLHVMRVGASSSEEVSFCLDNFTAYYGETPRQVDYLKTIADDSEKLLLFYGNIVKNADSSITDKSIAIDKSASLIPHYYNEETGFVDGISEALKEAIVAITGVDIEKLNEELRVANLSTLKTKLDEAEAYERTLANIVTRQALIDGISSFLEKNQFPNTDPDFAASTTRIGQLTAAIEQDTAVNLFIKEMNSFNQHFTFTSMTKHYATAAEAYEQLDPTYKYKSTSDQTKFQQALNIYAGADALLKEEEDKINSKKIIACMDKVKNYGPDEWAEYYDTINPYIVSVREIVRSGNYNPDVEDLEAALSKYNEMNAVLYDLLQQKHIAELQGRVDAFRTTTSYIERIGAVNYVEQYVENNDVDLTNPSILSIVNAIDVMKSEVEKQRDEYDELLNQNTERFASAVSIMKAFNDYATLKNYYDKATEYFYAMNIVIYEEGEVVLDVSDAILTYHEIGEKIARTENDSAELLKVTEEYDATAQKTKDLTYRYLVACYRLADNADDSIDGVAAARQKYLTALAAYNAEILPLNAEIIIAGDAMCAVRAICNLKGIMSMIRSILY